MAEEIARATMGGELTMPDGAAPAGFPELSGRQKAVFVAIALVVAIVSFFPLGAVFSSPDTYAGQIQELDEKKDTVMGLVGASTAASVGISLLPGDAGTPIANKLVDISSDFLVVIAAIYLEKYLLTILGLAAFRFLVPISCVMLIAAVLMRGSPAFRQGLAGLAAKVAVFGLALFIAVPASIFVSGMIESTYEASIGETIAKAQQTTEAIEGSAREPEGDSGESGGLLDAIQSLPNTLQSIPDEVAGLVAQAQEAVNGFVEALAVMIVTSCVIPILVLVFFLWLAKSVLGLNVDAPMRLLYPRAIRRK